MRLDNFISDLGIIKRRTIAKELADGGHIKVNSNRAKPGLRIKENDIIEITGKRLIKIKVLAVPSGKSVARDDRAKYFEILQDESARPDY